MKKLLSSIVLLAGIVVSCNASALFYAEFNPGYVNSGDATLNTNGLNLQRKQDRHFGWNANLGFQFLILGVEVGYTDFNNLKWQQAGTTSSSSDIYSYHIAAVKEFDLGPIFVRGKIGAGQIKRGSFDFSNVHINDKDHTDLYWGLGAGMNITSTFYGIVQYQQIQGHNGTPNMNLTSVGVGLSF